MPGLDGTGPRGLGPLTGGGRGACNPYGSMWGMRPGFGAGPAYGVAPGYPMGRGVPHPYYQRPYPAPMRFGRGYGPYGSGMPYGAGVPFQGPVWPAWHPYGW